MNTLAQIKQTLGGKIVSWDEKNASRIYVTIDPTDIVAVATYLFRDMNLRFIVISGVDTPDAIELLYHFSLDATGAVVTVRTVLTDKKDLSIASLTGLMKGSSWIEREIHELLGVNFTGHPNLKHLLLSDDWPAGNYPLRRDNK